MINRLTYTVIDCYWGPKESITITSNNKSFQLLIDKFRQSPCTSTSYTHVELYDGDNLIEEFTSQYIPNKEEIKAEPKEEKPVKEPARRKKNTSGDYRETYFMRVDLTDRQPLYVSRTTHEKLMKIVTVIGGRKATVSSYVENILLRHFDQYQDEINELYESKFEKPF